MVDRKGWDVVHRISGHKSKTGGMSVGNAFSAGIKREVPMPKHMQEVADSIKPPEVPSEKKPARKSTLIEKYNVAGEIADIKPEIFRGIFRSQSGSIIRELKELGVTTIKISSGLVDMDFEIYDQSKNDSEWIGARHIGARDIVTSGIVQAVGLDQKIIVSNQTRIMGFIRVNSTDPVFARIGADRAKSEFHTTEWGKMGEINAQAVFIDSETVHKAAFHYKMRGGVHLNHLFKDSANNFKFLMVGKLLHPDLMIKHNVDFNSLRQIQIQHVAGMLASTKADTQEKLISDVFREATQGYALYAAANYNVPPVAVLIPAKADTEQNTGVPKPQQP